MEQQPTKNPICPICKDRALTDQEIAKSSDGKGRCWYCITESFVQLGMEAMIADPSLYGRANETVESGIARAKQKHFKGAITPEVVEQVNAAPGAQLAAPGNKKGSITMAPPVLLTVDERKAFITKFGYDPQPKVKPTEIVVHGSGDDTYLKFSVPFAVDAKEEQEIKRILGGILEIFGKLLKYGPQFASTLIELENINPEMFIGGRGR